MLFVVVVVLSHQRFLRFRATFSCHRHQTLASQARESLHRLWALPWLLLAALVLLGFSVTFAPRAGLGRAFFTHRRFLACTPFPHFGTFLWLRCRQEHPIQNPPRGRSKRASPREGEEDILEWWLMVT